MRQTRGRRDNFRAKLSEFDEEENFHSFQPTLAPLHIIKKVGQRFCVGNIISAYN